MDGSKRDLVCVNSIRLPASKNFGQPAILPVNKANPFQLSFLPPKNESDKGILTILTSDTYKKEYEPKAAGGRGAYTVRTPGFKIEIPFSAENFAALVKAHAHGMELANAHNDDGKISLLDLGQKPMEIFSSKVRSAFPASTGPYISEWAEILSVVGMSGENYKHYNGDRKLTAFLDRYSDAVNTPVPTEAFSQSYTNRTGDRTLFLHAASSWNIDALTLLAKRGADVTATDDGGNALNAASTPHLGGYNAFVCLLDLGVPVIKDEWGMTPQDQLRRFNYHALADLIDQRENSRQLAKPVPPTGKPNTGSPGSVDLA